MRFLTAYTFLVTPNGPITISALATKPEDLIRAFTEVGQAAVDDGADVLIPAEGVMNEVL